MHVDANGTRLWFDVDGTALVPDGDTMRRRPTTVLLHGGPGGFDHSYFKPDFGRLAEVAQVVYLDLPGHGRSQRGDPASWTFEGAADRVRDFCDALGIEAPVVYGHSLGGMVAMLYAARHPEHPGALILASTLGRFDLDAFVEGFRRLAGDEVADIVARSYGGDGERVTAEEWERCWTLFGPWVTGEVERARTVANQELNAPGLALMRQFDALEQLEAIRCPTLVCVGDLDPATTVEVAREIVDALPPGVGRLEVVPGAGHFPWKDQPEPYWRLLTGFLTS